jgi:hypothetical protein
MAVTATINVSGIRALRYILVDTTTFYFTNAVDGQKLTVTLQQDATGSRTIVSGNCPGLIAPSATATDDTTSELTYDASNNTWNSTPAASAPGALQLNTTTTNTALAWSRGTYLASGALTYTITNPVAGPPGVGNDGEVMLFISQAASVVKITMGTTSTINGTSTSIVTAGANGDAIALVAWGGKVYTQSVTGAFTLS